MEKFCMDCGTTFQALRSMRRCPKCRANYLDHGRFKDGIRKVVGEKMNCSDCGNEIIRTDTHQTRCAECSRTLKKRAAEQYHLDNYQRRIFDLTCLDCGNAFQANQKTTKRCHDCRAIWRRSGRYQAQIGSRILGTKSKCVDCGTEIIKTAHNLIRCRRCQKTHNNESHTKRYSRHLGDVLKCVDCDSEFKMTGPSQIRCHDCTEKLINSDHRLENKNVRRQAKIRAGHRCELPGCDFNIALHAHHIVPRREHGPNELHNLIVLCPNHHAMADKNLISRERLFVIRRANPHVVFGKNRIKAGNQP